MQRKFTAVLLVLMLLFTAFPAVGFSQGYSRNVTATFDNLQLYVDGQLIHMSREPFLINGDIYVPLADFSRALSLQYTYSDKDKKATLTTGGASQQTQKESFAAQLVQRDYQIAALNQELKALEQQKGEASGKTSSDVSIRSDSEMQSYLQDRFDTLNNIPMTISFYHYRSDRYRLHITFPYSDRGDFDTISQRTVNRYLEDILHTIRELYNRHADIDGYIRHDRSNPESTYIEFETNEGELESYFNRSSSSSSQSVEARKLKEALESNIGTYNDVRFYYDVYIDNNRIDVTVSFYNDDYYDWSSAKRRDFLRNIQEEIEDLQGKKTVYGRIVDANTDMEALLFTFEDGEISSSNPKSAAKPEVPREKNEKTPVSTAVTRNLTLWFYDISVVVDQKPVYLSENPFLYEGEVYISAADFADDLYMGYHYDVDEKKIDISTNGALRLDSDNALLGRIFIKNQEINRLTEQVEDLRQTVLKMAASPYTDAQIFSVSRMEAFLRDNYEDFEDFDTAIRFSRISDNEYRLRITYDLNDFDDFDVLSNSMIRNWVDDMYAAVRDLFDRYAKITGSIRSTPSNSVDTTYITFKTEDGQLSFDFEEHGGKGKDKVDVKELADELNNRLRRFNNINFYYEVSAVRKNANLNIYFNDDRFYDWSEYRKMDYLISLQDKIDTYYGPININGKIIDSSTNKEALRFSFEDGIIRSATLLEELENSLNKYNQRFSYGDETLRFTYYITEKDATHYRVKMEGNFSKSDSKWKYIEESGMSSFESYVMNALDTIADVFPVNLTAEIYDQNGQHVMSISRP
ncbi:stalk domain-containing protein [Geosporobacter ferrireducens]|uniref:Copper amine oxidase-like N-terminal domain-containing protein n=1 Tax=Geosporobacter ferrireducens TaxID=1424294 RepID=A0A1D8GGX3_9FIRM|nr:stalk domain-containing protein [Geosporobacter ferrireducens]AOT70161.1 hypothetical protein Gferi_11495 [Geosporobacter ferrireducens]